MARINLKHSPDLTKEQLRDMLSAHFTGLGYEVGLSALIGADIYVKKNAWVGVTIKLKQKSDSTFLRIGGYAPSIAVRLLLYGLITYLILLPKWNRLVKDVRELVTAENFNA